jgi:hypothetical protein
MADQNPYSVGAQPNYAAPLLDFMGPANALKQKQQQQNPQQQPGQPLNINPQPANGAPNAGQQGMPSGLAQVLQRMFGQQQPQQYQPNGPAPQGRVDVNGRPIQNLYPTGIY